MKAQAAVAVATKQIRRYSSAVAPDLDRPAPVQEFKPPGELERTALPRSSPDLGMLAGLPLSGLPIRLRLFIDATGTVVDVNVLKSADDPEVLSRIRQMFLATGFIPGRMHGVDVASYRDLELSLNDLQ